jgi:hypothetical protein
MESNKYEFLTQLAVRMVDSINEDVLSANILRLAATDEQGTSLSAQLVPGDPEFMSFYLFYLLLTRLTRAHVQRLTVENSEAAANLVEKLTLLVNCLKNGFKPFSAKDVCSLLTQGLLPADSYSISGGFSGDDNVCPVPVDKLDFATRLLPDILYLSASDNKVRTLPDMCRLGIDCLQDSIKYFKQPPIPDKPVITARGDHLEFPI